MSYDGAPANVRSLEQRMRNLEGDTKGWPSGVGSGWRWSSWARCCPRVRSKAAAPWPSATDATPGSPGISTPREFRSLASFRRDFEASLATGWAGFSGRLVERPAPRPPRVPTSYVMQPFEVKLAYRGRAWCTVDFELGHNEIGDADDPEHRLASDLAGLFTEIGLAAPDPVPVMRPDHQVAQKLHAASGPDSERARDLVDLQLIERGENLDMAQVAVTCTRLFTYRRQQAWPPTVAPGPRWDTLYTQAAEGLDVLPSIDDAVPWANAFIQRIAAMSPEG